MQRSTFAAPLLFASLVLTLTGCGSQPGSTSNPAQPAQVAPALVTQPSNQSVPMGLSGTFTASASGSSLEYQWEKNGSPIAGATSASYTTPATAFSDSGANFTVTVSNSAGSVTSNAASLTITARAPAAGDLRFQQIDAPSTVNGYGSSGGMGSTVMGGLETYFGGAYGSPVYISALACAAPMASDPRLGCNWNYIEFDLPPSLASTWTSVGYGDDVYGNFQSDLQSAAFPAGGTPVDAPNSVVTSLNIQPANQLFGASWIQSSQSSGFNVSVQTVSSGQLQAAATQEGAHSRVITAVSFDGANVVYLSYGWQSDTSTIYETSVATATFATAQTAAANLAAQGYLITAMGGSDPSGNLYLVGTRVQGDTMARPFASVTGTGTQESAAIMQPGYAIVGMVQDAQGNLTILGER